MGPSLKRTATAASDLHSAPPPPPMPETQSPKYTNFSFLRTKERPSFDREDSRSGLIASAADMGRSGGDDDDDDKDKSASPARRDSLDREPKLPDVGVELRELR